jgi:hypothetical protein
VVDYNDSLEDLAINPPNNQISTEQNYKSQLQKDIGDIETHRKNDLVERIVN